MKKQERCDLQNLQFPPSFFADETREGFFVSSMMKRYWAAQLTILTYIDRVCRKYGIPWFIDCGTLLGGVRHGGFIPWDDDMDICMLRDDYVRFFEVAKEELPQEYQVLDLRIEPEYSQMIGRIVNAHSIQWNPEHMEQYHGCPYTVGIDIFPLDALAKDDAEEEKRREKLQIISRAYTEIQAGNAESEECRKLLSDIERQNRCVLHRKGNLERELLVLADKLYAMYPTAEAEYVALMPFWVSHHDHRYAKELFEDRLLLPFENTSLPAPARYDEVLKIEYGDYMKIYAESGIHIYPVYKEQEQILKEHLKQNPFRFTLRSGMPDHVQRPETIRKQCLEMLGILVEAHRSLEQLQAAGDLPAQRAMLEGCQNVAVSLGTRLENRFSDCEAVIHLLEDYCEQIFLLYSEWNRTGLQKLDETIGKIRERLETYLANRRKEVLFLPCKAIWWETLRARYEEAMQDENTDVFVMQIPYYEKRNSKEQLMKCEDQELFPADLLLTGLEQYDITKRYPDEIVIQYPFDEYCTYMRIPEFFYSGNLRKYTQHLTYVPCFAVDSSVQEGTKGAQALKVLIEQPAVLYADEIVLDSENLRELYVQTLAGITGEKTREDWLRKISVTKRQKEQVKEQTICKDLPAQKWRERAAGKKVLLYQVNAPFLLQYKERALEKIQRSLEIIAQNSGELICVFSPHELTNEIGGINGELWEKWNELLQTVRTMDSLILDETCEAEECVNGFDAYYGTEGELANRFRWRRLPVMIMNVEV